MPTETPTKPRWVECADKASEVLTAAREADPTDGAKDAIVREAHAWMQLAYLYADRTAPTT